MLWLQKERSRAAHFLAPHYQERTSGPHTSKQRTLPFQAVVQSAYAPQLFGAQVLPTEPVPVRMLVRAGEQATTEFEAWHQTNFLACPARAAL